MYTVYGYRCMYVFVVNLPVLQNGWEVENLVSKSATYCSCFAHFIFAISQEEEKENKK